MMLDVVPCACSKCRVAVLQVLLSVHLSFMSSIKFPLREVEMFIKLTAYTSKAQAEL